MMSRRLKQGLLISCGLLLTGAASAHTTVLEGQGLYHGLLHPISGLDHLLALFAVGLLASRYRLHNSVGILAMLLGLMVVGATAGIAGLALPVVELGITGSLLLLGGLIAIGKQLPPAAALLTISLVGILHGYAHGQEMAAGFNTGLYFSGFLLSSLGTLLLGLLAGRLQQQYGEKLYRFSGGLITLGGLGLFGSSL